MTRWPAMAERGPAVTAEDVARFEQRLGLALPADFRSYLLEVNGGRTTKQHRELAHGVLNSLLSLEETEEMFDLEAQSERVRRDLGTDEILVVGFDDGGGRILLVVAGEQRGRVYLQLHDERPGGSNPRVLWHDRRDMRKLADSFEAFLTSLRPLS